MVFNGLNAVTGQYELPPLSHAELVEIVRGQNPPENLAELHARHQRRTGAFLGVVEGVDPNRLDEAGWGIIFAHDADPAIAAGLSELIEYRRGQAGSAFRVLAGDDGVHPGERKTQFLARHGVGPGPADPAKLPYYLLIVGSPEQIPFEFQYQLDVQYAVGRVCFDTPAEYANYARSVVQAETGQVRRPRSLTFFSPANADDAATNLSTEQLVAPLHAKLCAEHPDWQVELIRGDQATKTNLAAMLRDDRTPGLLFLAGHGLNFPAGHPQQRSRQGALVCQDWPGPLAWQQPLPSEFYFAADDLGADATVAGGLVFCYACYGAGTPRLDNFAKLAFRQPMPIAPQPFVAALPTKLLGLAQGGALALIGHVERTWGYSFRWPGAGTQTAVFASTLARLLKGHTVGAAVEYFNERYAELATVLTAELDDADFGRQVDPVALAELWTANNDARGYAVIGDPAVRLSVTVDG
jgi:hypothetical protein